MQRSNVPNRSMRYFSNRKRSFSRSPRTASDTRLSDSQQGSSCPINNILVFPKNSETTINVLSDNSQSLPYGNLLKKIKGRKRKDKQRLKKKQNFEVDVKPEVGKVKPLLKSEEMKPRMNKHIIFLSDSDNENSDNQGPSHDSSMLDGTFNKTNFCVSDEDDDVIFVETPPAEIIEIDDATEKTETSERTLDNSDTLENSCNQVSSPDVNDFLDKAPINLNPQFNFELHGSEFKGTEFLKPSTVPKDMSESGSVSSISDISATIGMNVFNVVDFPKERVNLFDDNNLEKFRDSITPQRLNKKTKSLLNNEEIINSEHKSSLNENLPTLSDIQVDDNSRKQRGRSIIKELVNDRAYIILSAAEKKLKSKKRKSREHLSDTFEEENQNDVTQESSKKKKKKKHKKKDTSPDGINFERSRSPLRNDIVDDEKSKKRKERSEDNKDETSNYPTSIRTDIFEPTESEISTRTKKSKKNKRVDLETSVDEGDTEKRKRKIKKTKQEIFDNSTKNNEDEDIIEDTEEKKKKKNKRTSELSIENRSLIEQNSMEASNIQETSEEKKKKKSKRTLEVSTGMIERNEIGRHNELHVPDRNEERKKKKCRRTSEVSNEISAEENKIEQQCITLGIPENVDEKRKKKNRKTPAPLERVTENVGISNKLETQEEPREIVNQNEDLVLVKKNNKTDQQNVQEDISDNNVEKRKQKTSKVSDLFETVVGENLIQNDKLEKEGKHENSMGKTKGISVENNKTLTETFEKKMEKKKFEKNPKETTTLDHTYNERVSQDIEMVEVQDEIGKLQNVTINVPSASKNETVQKSETDVTKTRMHSIKISEAPENIIRKTKVKEHNKETELEDNKEKRKMYEVQEISKEINQKSTEDQNVENEKYIENISEISDTFNSLRKRKNQTSISENVQDPLESTEPKRIKIAVEIQQPQIDNSPENEKSLLENKKNEEKVHVDETPSKTDEGAVTREENINDISSLHKSSAGVKEILLKPKIIENVDNYKGESRENPEVPQSVNSVPVDTKENIVELINVFPAVNQSIFPREDNFTKDVNVNNFLDSSWNADPSRFQSYNESLFNDLNIQQSVLEKNSQVSNVESISELTETTSSELVESQSNQKSVLESDVPCNPSLHDLDEKIIVKNVNKTINDSAPENTVDIVSQGDVTVKIEVESEGMSRIAIEENTSGPTNSEKNVIAPGKLETDTSLKIIDPELPDEIEQIVKEKDNHDTVKKLCEFLEEARDPNEVLKKVSLLKQAFIDKSQTLAGLNEEVHISYDKDDVFSITSSDSSVVCLEDDVSVLSIDDDITLANCDLADNGKNKNKSNEISNNLVENSDLNEVITNTVQQNETIRSVASTSQSTLNSTFISSGTEYKKELDKFEVEDIQGYMSNDPKLWKIVSEDLHPSKHSNKGKRCMKCKELGHLGYNCPSRFNVSRCTLCGQEGHLDFRCPNKLCTQCGRKTPMMQNFCGDCRHYKNLTCVLCKNQGHPKSKCPDLWRRYHLTVNDGPLVKTNTLTLKTQENLWCSVCVKSGHVESQCDLARRKKFQPLDPRIHNYEDVYNIKAPVWELLYFQPNIEEVPSNTHIFFENDDSSSTSSSSSSNDDIDNSTQKDSSVLVNDDTLKDNQPGQNLEAGFEDLPPEFVVVDETIDEKQDIGSITNQKKRNFFMTATVQSLTEFLSEKLSIFESCRFEIKDIDHLFYIYQDDNKKPPHEANFELEHKEIFYRELNMLLFGKLKIRSAHVNKLENFVNSTPDSVSASMRESLCYSYNYIFSNKLHDHVNYEYFVKMIRRKYGNQQWIY